MARYSLIHWYSSVISYGRRGARGVAIGLAVTAFVLAALTLEGARTANSQSSSDCEATDLGTLGTGGEDLLEATGRWTTRDCDSEFLPNSDAHNYRFTLAEDGQVRIDLTSADGDSYLHLLEEDGSPIKHDDDSGLDLDSRIEYNLSAGVYLVEAAEGAGRGRGASDFTLTIQRAANCEAVYAGRLTAGGGLNVSGEWTADDCQARFRDDSPARTYQFHLPEAGLVRIDLIAPEGGDPYLYLLDLDGGYLYSDDDSGAGRNSRIENDLPAGSYLVEATTWGDREHTHELTSFELKIQLADEFAFRMKAETVVVPEEVVAGEPVTVDYRVGNAGRTDLPEGYSAAVRIYARGVYDSTDTIAASDGRWEAGVSYHSGERTAIRSSVSIDETAPFVVTFRRPGWSWAYLAVITFDENDDEFAFHGARRELLVLSGFTFGKTTVSVDGTKYEVSAEADEEGTVTTSVASVADRSSEVDAETRAKAIYTAGVQTQILDGIFERPAISAIPASDKAQSVRLDDPSSDTMLKSFGEQYASAIAAAGLSQAVAGGEAINPVTVEDMALGAADTASARFQPLAASWTTLQEGIEAGNTLSFEEALGVHSQVAYAERIISPVAAVGEVVRAARAADAGWDNLGVQAMVSNLEEPSCRSAETALSKALDAADVSDVDGLLKVHAEIGAALPSYGRANDTALCAASNADDDNSRFLDNLSIGDDAAVVTSLGLEPPAPATAAAPSPHRLRILARMVEDGRIEHGVELSGGERVLPSSRYLSASAPVGEWLLSSDVEVDGAPIGKILSRHIEDGRIELGFLSADGERITPDIRFLPADMPSGVWMRSGEIEVAPVAVLE